jgi:hypothetical protein
VSRQRKVKGKESPPVEAKEPAPSPAKPDRRDPAPSVRPDPTTLGDDVGPPLHGKTDPPDAMDDTLPTLDDERRNYHHHPSETGAVDFEFDPLAGDAAADLAGDFGSQFLEGATRGEDLSERALAHEDDSDAPLDLLLDDAEREEEAESMEETDEPPEPPRSSGRRKAR